MNDSLFAFFFRFGFFSGPILYYYYYDYLFIMFLRGTTTKVGSATTTTAGEKSLDHQDRIGWKSELVKGDTPSSSGCVIKGMRLDCICFVVDYICPCVLTRSVQN